MKQHETDWVGLADIAMVSTAETGFPSPVFHELVQPAPDTAGVLVAGSAEVAKLGAVFANRLERDCDVAVSVQARHSDGPMGELSEWANCGGTPPTRLGPWETAELVCTIDASTSGAGWTSLRSQLTASSCWGANDTVQVLEGAVAVVMPQPIVVPAQRNVNPGVFGGQMLPTPGGAAAWRIGMRTVRDGPLWHWNQPAPCWNLSTCFDWGFGYDNILKVATTGLEVMIDARELAPPWAAAKNDSGGAWSSIPGPEHYADYQRWMVVMLQRYGSVATAVEVSNEQDGYAYFASDKLPFEYAVNEALATVNLTRDALKQCGANCIGIKLMGLSSSMFDVGQTGNGGSSYLHFEDEFTSAPGVMQTLAGWTFHTYAQGVWVPSNKAPWGNTTFYFPNESTGGWKTNSTVAEILVMADLLKQKAAAVGMADYHPLFWLSEMGYNLQLKNTVASGWTRMHGALVAHLLIHMRSAPVAQYVQKAFYFAAYDGCCVESAGYFGLWRPAFVRYGVNATADDGTAPYLGLDAKVPLAAVATYATASVLVDVPSGRLAGVFVVDNSNQSAATAVGLVKPSCVAFETDPTSLLHAPPLAVLMTTAHHYNDFTTAAIVVNGAATLLNGFGTLMKLDPSTLRITALPQYLILSAATTATAVCETLHW
jgi:hypothetical protein